MSKDTCTAAGNPSGMSLEGLKDEATDRRPGNGGSITYDAIVPEDHRYGVRFVLGGDDGVEVLRLEPNGAMFWREFDSGKDPMLVNTVVRIFETMSGRYPSPGASYVWITGAGGKSVPAGVGPDGKSGDILLKVNGETILRFSDAGDEGWGRPATARHEVIQALREWATVTVLQVNPRRTEGA